MKTNKEYKNEALASLLGNWPKAVLCTVVYVVLAVSVSLIIEFVDPISTPSGTFTAVYGLYLLLMIFVVMPLSVGYYVTYRELLFNGADDMTRNMFKFGFGKWWHNTWGMLLTGIFVFLWSLLLIIPGLIKSFAYALTPYILVDRPELSANEAINLSQKMMKGHKFDLFWLMLSFLGWILLSVLTLGVGLFWLTPYMYTAYAAFYRDVKAEYETRNNSIN